MNLTVDRLLFGSPDLTDDQNNSLFLNVQKFIITSKRFIYHQQYLVPIFHSSFLIILNQTFFTSNTRSLSLFYLLIPSVIYIKCVS